MKIEIYGQPEVVKEEKIVRLALEHCTSASGGFTLCAVDETGERMWCGNLLFINTDGTFTLASDVSSKIGLPLKGGKITFKTKKVAKEASE